MEMRRATTDSYVSALVQVPPRAPTDLIPAGLARACIYPWPSCALLHQQPAASPPPTR